MKQMTARPIRRAPTIVVCVSASGMVAAGQAKAKCALLARAGSAKLVRSVQKLPHGRGFVETMWLYRVEANAFSNDQSIPYSQYDVKIAKSARSTSQSSSKSAGTLSVVNDQMGPAVCSPQAFSAITCQ